MLIGKTEREMKNYRKAVTTIKAAHDIYAKRCGENDSRARETLAQYQKWAVEAVKAAQLLKLKKATERPSLTSKESKRGSNSGNDGAKATKGGAQNTKRGGKNTRSKKQVGGRCFFLFVRLICSSFCLAAKRDFSCQLTVVGSQIFAGPCGNSSEQTDGALGTAVYR